MTEPLTHTPQVKRLERSPSDRVVAGVSGGLGRYFDLNPAVFRLGFVVLTLLGGAGLLIYLAAVLVIPDEGEEQSIAAEVLAERRDRPWPLVGLGLIGVATLVLISRGRALAERRRRLGRSLARRRARHPLDEPPRQPRHGGSRSRRPSRVSVLLAAAIARHGRRVRLVQRQPRRRRRRPRRTHRRPPPRSSRRTSSASAASASTSRTPASRRRPTIEARVGVGELRVIVPRDARVSRRRTRRRPASVHRARPERRRHGTPAVTRRPRPDADDRRPGRRRPHRRRSARRDRRSRRFPSSAASDDRVLAGVCGGLAATLGVDATLVRLVFALLALAGGAGILLYFALWVYAAGRRAWIAAALVVLSALALLLALGLSTRGRRSAPACSSRASRSSRARGGSLRPGGSLPIAGIALDDGRRRRPAQPPRRVAARCSRRAPLPARSLLVVGPWLWQLAEAERTERIRLEERAEVAARVHDSVLQTLALVQRARARAARASPRSRAARSASCAAGSTAAASARRTRSATRSPRRPPRSRSCTASGSSSRARGDCPLDDAVGQVVLAAREAMTNAAKFSGADEISVYAEVDDDAVSVFVRDRGAGFDRAAVASDRRGIAESIEGRMARAGGRADRHVVAGRGHRGRADAAERRCVVKPRRARRRPRALPRRRARRAGRRRRDRRRGRLGRRGGAADPRARSGRRPARRPPARRRRRGGDRRASRRSGPA